MNLPGLDVLRELITWTPFLLTGFSLNILIGWLVFLVSERLVGFMGQGGIKAISRVFNLLLAALAVNMIIRGLVLIGVLKV